MFSMKFGVDIHGAQMMDPIVFDDFLTFPLAPPWSMVQSENIFPTIEWMKEICDRYLRSFEENV